jgi:hypothetical protein
MPTDLRAHPIADARHQTTVLGHGDKLRRDERPANRMMPAQQRLNPRYLAGVKIDARLVVDLKLAPHERTAQLGAKALSL